MVTKRLLGTSASTAKQDQPPWNSTAEEWLPSTVLGRASQQNTRRPQYILLITVNNICVLVIIINNHRSVSIKALKWLNYNKYDIKLGENTNEWWLMNWNNYKKPSQKHWGGSDSRKNVHQPDCCQSRPGAPGTMASVAKIRTHILWPFLKIIPGPSMITMCHWLLQWFLLLQSNHSVA